MRRLNEYAPLFVLWSAETFRREFDGGQYTWAFLTDRLTADSSDFDLQHVSRLGLSSFGRKLARNQGGMNFYLKTLAAEGGLPEALLADPEGNTRRLARGLLTDITKVGQGAPEGVLDALTAQRAQFLPMGFRTEEFRTLLRDFCLLLLRYKAEIPAGIPPEARQSWLDANRSGWKDALPLRIDTTAAQSLLNEAVRAENGAGRDTIATRHLVRIEDHWVAKLRIAASAELPDWMLALDAPNLRSLRFLPDTDLARQAPGLVLSAYKGPGERNWDVRHDGGARRAEIAMPLESPVAFRLMAEGEHVGKHVPPGCEAIGEDDIPTVWAAEEPQADGKVRSLRKLGASAQRTRAPHLWILARDGDAKFEDLETKEDGRIGSASLWRVNGKGIVITPAGRLSIMTGAEDEATDSLLVSASSVLGLRDSNRSDFLQGVPTFQALTVDGIGRRLNRTQMIWLPAGQRIWKKGLPDPASCLGTYQFCWTDDNGSPRAFATARLIPEKAHISLVDCNDGFYECRATAFPVGTVISLPQGVSGIVAKGGTLTLRISDALASMNRIAVHIRPPEGGARAFDASLPRPSDSGHFVDAEERILANDIALDLGSLRGWRISAPADRKAELRLRLQGEHVPRKPVMVSVSNDTSLSALLPQLRGLMAIGGPDSELRMRVMVGATQSRRIKLRRHLRDGSWSESGFSLGQDDGNVAPGGLEIEAVNLSAPSLSTTIEAARPGDDPMPRLPEHPGPWMIFARDEGGLVRPPRPMLKTVTGDIVAAPRFSDEMLSCGNHRRREERISAFGRALKGLLAPQGAGDLGLYEAQLDALGEGEALSSLDSIVALSEAPELACLLLLRAGPDTLGARFDLESVSPFSWTTLPFKAWCKAMIAQESALFSQLLASGLPEYDARKYSRQAVAHRLREILDRRPEISGQIFFASMKTGAFDALIDLCPPPLALNAPEKTLVDLAQNAIKKHEAAGQPFPMRSRYAPPVFDTFFNGFRGLLDAPMVAAEHVLGLLPHPPDTETAVALLHYRLHDPDYFEAAMPAAFALIQAKTK
ncbi:hypothetical protein LA6_003315 [Marinibacterium anthonyi]|nr:hypothetical protein LA6_003315 [Marinibacterium anthonyi]